MKLFCVVSLIVFCAALPTMPPVPKPGFDPSKPVNDEVLCIKPPFLEKICVGYHLESCDKQAIGFNLTYGGDNLFPPIDFSAGTAGKKICVSNYKDLIPPNIYAMLQGCDVCVGIKDGWTIFGTFAKFCPLLSIQCKIQIGGKTIEGEAEQIDLSCVELGTACEATSCSECNKYGTCGWCAGAVNPASGRPGVCMSSLASQPYCEKCNIGWMPQASQCPTPPPAPGKIDKGGSSSSSHSDGPEPATIVACILGAIVLGVLGFVVYKKANARGTMLAHDPSLHTKFSQPIDLQDDESDTVDLHAGNTSRVPVIHG